VSQKPGWSIQGTRRKRATHLHRERAIDATAGPVVLRSGRLLHGMPVGMVNTQRFLCPDCNETFDHEWPA
jgi:hypothetical protein